MNINWKLRFQNKASLTAIVVQGITLVYTILGMIGIVPGISEDQVINVLSIFVELLCLLGIVVDPTTKGIGDSNQAMVYTQPK